MANKDGFCYRFISIVAALCMTLYGYDASTYNSIQASDNWLAWFDLTSVRGLPTNISLSLFMFSYTHKRNSWLTELVFAG